MGILELLILGVGLSMDAFAVAICKGLSIKKLSLKDMLIVGLWFGFFQGAMPLLGYLFGSWFSESIRAVDHWIAFVLLCLIGANMIREALKGDEEKSDSSLNIKVMLPLALATSIDALAVGVSLACLEVNIYMAVLVIALITFLISACGVKIGNVFGLRFKTKAEILGGVILIGLGIKILIEHLFFWG